MEKRFCDRCGKEIINDTYWRVRGQHLLRGWLDKDTQDASWDYCPDCYDQLASGIASPTARDEEIAELRLLVRDLLPCYRWSDCGDQPCMNDGGVFGPCPLHDIEQRVAALGIEEE